LDNKLIDLKCLALLPSSPNSFERKRISFEVSLVTPCYLLVVFNFMRTITLLVLATMCIVGKGSMSLLSVSLVLENTWVYVSSLNHCNILSYIEIFVNEFLGLYIVLRVPNVNLYNSHI